MNGERKGILSSQRWDDFGRIVGSICNLIAGGSVLFMAIITFADVSGRFFNYAIPGTYELVELMMAPAVFLALFYAQRRGTHIRITILYQRFHGRTRIWLDVFASFIGCLVLAITGWGLLLWGITSWKIKEVALGMVDIPVYPFKFIAAIGCLMLAITYCGNTMRSFSQLFKSGRLS